MVKIIKGSDVRKFIYEKVDTTNDERFTYSQRIIEQNYKVPTEFFENDTTINFKEIFSKREIVIRKDQVIDNEGGFIDPPEERYVKVGRFEGAEKAYLERDFDAYASKLPIHQRVSNQEITIRLDR